MDIPAFDAALAWLAAGGPGATLAAVEAAKPLPTGRIDALSVMFSGAWQSRANDAALELRAWANGKGAVGRWADAQTKADGFHAEGNRKELKAANEKAAELRPSAETEWANARAGLAAYFADAGAETGAATASSDPQRVGKW